MSGEEYGLVWAILANPHDSFLRNAYADWLDDRGHFWAKEVREGGKSNYWHPPRTKFTIERGFITGVETGLEDFKEMAEELFSRNPVERVILRDVTPATTDREPGFKDYFFWDPRRYRHKLDFLGALLIWNGWKNTEEEACESLSDALVTWGRSLVKPTLPFLWKRKEWKMEPKEFAAVNEEVML